MSAAAASMRLAVFLGLSLALAACARRAPQSGLGPGPKSPAAQTAARSGPFRTPAVREPKATMEQVSAASGAQLLRLLGPPTYIRTEGAAQVWQYVADCVLDLTLYPGDGPGALRVRHVEGRDLSGSPTSARECLRRQ